MRTNIIWFTWHLQVVFSTSYTTTRHIRDGWSRATQWTQPVLMHQFRKRPIKWRHRRRGANHCSVGPIIAACCFNYYYYHHHHLWIFKLLLQCHYYNRWYNWVHDRCQVITFITERTATPWSHCWWVAVSNELRYFIRYFKPTCWISSYFLFEVLAIILVATKYVSEACARKLL